MEIQRITVEGKQFVLVPEAAFNKLVEASEMEEDTKYFRAAMAKRKSDAETVSAEFVMQLNEASHKGGSLLKLWREYRGLTQQQLATASKVKQAYISDIERGVKPGSAITLKALARVLECDVDELIP